VRLLAAMNALCPDGLVADETLYGGGLHLTSRLDVHLDCDAHPQTGYRRAINAILYLDTLQEGPLELWSEDVSACVAQVYPARGRLCVFETNDVSYHGVPHEVSTPRRSLAVYWWEPTRAESRRPRAQFVARPGDELDPLKEEWRRKRST
jgi:hypothetical protein